MRTLSILMILAALAGVSRGQSAISGAFSSERKASFRPTPLRGESSIRGRSLSLRPSQNAKQLFVLNPANPSTTVSRQAKAAAARARLRASQQARSRLAAQSLRSTRTARPNHQASHSLTPGFVTPEPEELYIAEQQASRNRWLRHAETILDARAIDVEFNGRTAILRGDVGSAEDARILEKLLLLEPGIDQVENRLAFASE